MTMKTNIPNVNVWVRTRMIRTSGIGAGILIDINEQQFFVTAKHMFEPENAPGNVSTPLHLDMNVRGRWFSQPVIRFGVSDADLAVLELDWDAPWHPITLGSDGVILAQDLFILGFPDGLYNVAFDVKDTMAIVGRATLSGANSDCLLIQCNAFHGFSGGPVVDMTTTTPKVVGIISQYHSGRTPLQYANGHPVPTGFVECVPIEKALDVINNRMAYVA